MKKIMTANIVVVVRVIHIVIYIIYAYVIAAGGIDIELWRHITRSYGNGNAPCT